MNLSQILKEKKKENYRKPDKKIAITFLQVVLHSVEFFCKLSDVLTNVYGENLTIYLIDG